MPGSTKAWVVDCETTGLAGYDRIVSFAAVEMLGPEPTGRVSYLLFNPGRPCHPRAAAVHGWRDDVLRKQEEFTAHAPFIHEILSKADVVCGHNLGFDLGFLHRELAKVGLSEIRTNPYCTMQAYRNKFPGRKATLDLCLQDIGGSRAGETHGALEDAFLAASLYAWLRFGVIDTFGLNAWPDPFNLRS
ncbi:3'-5' exonuclease [Xanthobacter oligotrophicus]|uniref:3'-5' exonuclease n=1 Tax=Xanthobacter oligotrophicus TaxID=2607286 RepID=UPI0011F30317|nr:3'-5' exonuclease [Xanthobacter oligotrophicus]MCG5235485.1 3'-5' exonuclease [Xanthobacter oligotrophicus]